MAEDNEATDGGTVNFQGACGESNGTNSATSVGMAPGQSATVNGAPPSNCVVGNDGAKVYSVQLVYNSGYYDYQIIVDAQGPSGIFGGYFYLAFKDQSGDVYHLRIYSSRRENHTVSFDSSKPNITTIYWSNKDISADAELIDGNREKPSFQVISPVVPAGKGSDDAAAG